MLTLTNYTHNMIFVFSVDPVQQIFANQSARWFLMSNSEEASLLVERLKEQYVEEEQGSANWETELEMDSGKVYYSIESFIGYQNDKKTIVHIISNTTERKKRENFMYTLAYTDTLTGLNNRRYAMNLMDKWIKEETPFVLSFIDVDYLKYCNDTFGHEQGDRYLTATAALLQTLHCEVCRLGGDEFLLLSVGTDAAAQDEQLARLRKLFSEQTDVPYPRSFSFATTAVPARPPVSLSKYLEITDKKMHQYKIRNKRPLSDTSYKDDRRI